MDLLERFLFIAFPVLWLWWVVAAVSGIGDALGWWDYATVCTPREALTFCWTGQK